MFERREFLAALAGAPWVVGQTGRRTDGQFLSDLPVRPSVRLSTEEWDMSWLDRLTARHKQVFDFANLEIGLVVVKNWYDAFETVYRLKHPDVHAIVGIGGHAFPVNAGDALWQKYPLGELWKINDPETGKPATRNVFLNGGKAGPFLGAGVRPLQERGARFWMCNNALHGVAARVGAAVKRPPAELYTEFRAGLLPGVIVVPAHTMLIGLCQERGCTYEALP